MQQVLIGAEFGSNKVVVSRLMRNKIDGITSEASNIEIPAVVGFTSKERNFSEQGLVKLKRNFETSVISLPNIIGNFDQTEAQYQYSHCIEKEGKFFFPNINLNKMIEENKMDEEEEVVKNKVEEGVFSEQVLAGYANYLENLISKKNPLNFYSVFSVPSFYTTKQKKQFEQAFSIARFPLLKVVEEHVAISAAYLSIKKQDLMETEGKGRNVLFVDVGYTNTNIFYTSFQPQEAHVRYVNCIQGLGIRVIDNIMYEKVAEIFAEKNGEFPKNNKKIKIRLMDALEKNRKILSSNTETQIDVDCLVDEVDFSHHLTRDNFEKYIQKDFILKIEKQLKAAQKYLEQQNLKIDDIEIVGGGVRIPRVKQIIQDLFKVEKLGVCISVDSISRGCTLLCAQQVQVFNPLIKMEQLSIFTCATREAAVQIFVNGEKVRSESIQKYQPLPYTFQEKIDLSFEKYGDSPQIEVKFVSGNEQELNCTTVLTKNEAQRQRIQLQQFTETSSQQQQQKEEEKQNDDKMEVEGENQEQKSNQEQTQNEEKPQQQQVLEESDVKQQKDRKCQLVLALTFNQDQQVEVRQAIEQYSYLNQKDELLEFQTPFICQQQWSGVFTEQEIKAFEIADKKQRNLDQEVQKIDVMKNNLEKQIYEMRQLLQEELKVQFTQDEIDKLSNFLQQKQEWLEQNSHSDDINSHKLQDVINDLTQTFKPYKESLKMDDLMTVEVTSAEEMDKLQGQTINGLTINLRNKNVGDGGGFFGFFKKKGAIKIADTLKKINIHQNLNLDLGNANMSDEGVKIILQSAAQFKGLKKLSIDLESSLDNELKNYLTVLSLEHVQGLLQAHQDSLEVFSLCLGSIYEQEFVNLAVCLNQLKQMKSLTLDIKKGDIEESTLQQFQQQMQHLTVLNFRYQNKNITN